jgi:hypothetical protein
MPFSPLAVFSLSEEWQVTPVTAGNYFRFTCSDNIGFTYLLVAQAQVGDSGLIELFESRRFPITVGVAFLDQLISPPVISPEARRLAVRGLAPRSVQAPTLTLDIEASFNMIINPAGSTNEEKWTDFAPIDNLSRQIVAANANRNGGLIENRASKTLYIGLGVAADRNSPQKLAPGGRMDIPNGFVGAINGIFSAADLSPNAPKAVLLEYVSA